MAARRVFLFLLLCVLAAPASADRDGDAAAAPVNVNTAPPAQLRTLKGVGEKKARAIVAYRKAHGPFRSLDDFEEVPGVGPGLIERNRARIVFE